MKITRLSLTNFRSFKTTQTIDFAVLTLLLGPGVYRSFCKLLLV